MNKQRCMWCLVAALALIATPVGAQEKLPPDTKVVRLEARPSTVTLKTPFEYAQLLVTAQLDSGERVDVTRLVQTELPPALARLTPTGVLRPVADGRGELKCTLAGQTLTVPLQVSGQKDKYAVSFVRDVMPTLSKMGCNAGTCHGAQNGKNGFKLSLRGYDPLFDHQALTDDVSGRRFNRAAPERSLMLLKPAGEVPHVGGGVTRAGEPYYELLRAWIADGVKLDLQGSRVTGIDIFPKNPVVPLLGMKQQMAVLATYSDGSVRDVSNEAFVESSNTEVATVDKLGLVTAVRRGESAMLARYEGAYTATTLVVMGDRSGFVWKEVPTNNEMDRLVYDKLKQVKVLPSDLCTDADFLRRLYLDLIGLPPQPEDVRAFLADSRPTKIKRDELIDRLVGSAEYIEHWTNKWADLLQVNRKFLGEKGAVALRSWIRQAVAGNMPYDQFVYAILTGSGSTLENPPASYYKVLREPGAAMENTTQLFLAIRFNCNKCHDHPFERWTQDQYYHLAAYFAQVARKEDPAFKGQRVGGSAVEGSVPLVEIVADQSAGEVKHERTGVLAKPQFPYLHGDLAPATAPRREQLAKWIASKENPYFARSYVNRVWSYLLGVGLIEPVDDIRAGNPPSNPKLLDYLTHTFVENGFNVQELVRAICKSRTYQHSLVTNKWNADDSVNYSHALARRLPAEVLYDTLHRVTGTVTHLAGMPAGLRAAQQLDSNVEVPSGFLDLFGRPARESACECERTTGSIMLGPVLNLVNGPVMAEAIGDPNNRIGRLVATVKDDKQLIEELFLAILNRPPAPSEVEAGLKALQGSGAEAARLETERAKLQVDLATYEKALPAKMAAWEKGFSQGTAWTVLEPAKATATKGATLTRQPDNSLLASGSNPTPEKYVVMANTTLNGITAIRLEALPDPSLPAMGPGRAPNGNFVLNEFRLMVTPKGEKAKAVIFRKAMADFSQDGWAVQGAIDGNAATGWAVAPRFGKRHVAMFEPAEPIVLPQGGTLTFTLDQQFPGRDHNLGRFRLSATTAKEPMLADGLPPAIAKALAVPTDKRSEAQKAELANYYRAGDAELARLQRALTQLPRTIDKRLLGAQDLAWALLNSPAFLFNH